MAGFGYRQPLPTDAGAGGALSVIDGTKETKGKSGKDGC